MSFSQRLIVAIARSLTGLICRVDDTQLARVPSQGPLIIITNHVNILEIPILYSHLQPRQVHGLVWAERWKNPLLGWVLDECEMIPLHRGEADLAALRKALELLQAGRIVVIAPEGTRSGDGCLQTAHPGMVMLALHSGAPLLPVVFYGSERYKDNLKRLRRTDFHLGVGKLFTLSAKGRKVTRQVRQQMMDEIMFRMATLLPEQYRGVYTDLTAATEDYLI